MPILRGAKKALRQTKRRTSANAAKREALRTAIKNLRKNQNAKTLSAFASLVDKLAKTGVIHPNKAQRIKSRAARAVSLSLEKAKERKVKSSAKTTA